jgi:predicted amidohydrolase YtcJ
VKFYADGWLVPRTCAMCRDFADTGSDGLLFMDSARLASRIEPFAARGWRIATHAIGDRGIETVLDAYELAWGNDRAAIAAATPRIEHASLQSSELASRIAAPGVAACIQPSFAVTDAPDVPIALGADRADLAYPWAAIAAMGARLLLGTDYPIEALEPLVGLARLVNGRSDRDGFATVGSAPDRSRLPLRSLCGWPVTRPQARRFCRPTRSPPRSTRSRCAEPLPRLSDQSARRSPAAADTTP